MKRFLENPLLNKILYGLYIIALFALVADYGFRLPNWVEQSILFFYIVLLVVVVFMTIGRYAFLKKKIVLNVFLFDILSVLFIVFCVYKQLNEATNYITHWLKFAIVLKLIREFAISQLNYKRSVINPAQLFIFSYVGIILIGTLLLMLPNATYNGIHFVDALFTSTSAVCVTGLIVVDTSSFFTPFGQSIIMLLIQAGGLGILTFASYFSYFFCRCVDGI